MDDGISDLFAVSILLIIVVYFVGFSTDFKTVSDSTTSLIYAATGRGPDGKFAQYPTTPKG